MNRLPAWRDEVDQSVASRWVRCALQVNPFAYLARHGVACDLPDEDSYNATLVAALCQSGVQLAAVTDHFRVTESESLLRDLHRAGITALPGFEANTSEGIHLLVIFDESTAIEQVSDAIKACKLHDPNVASPISELSGAQLMAEMASLDALCIAAHATLPNGLLRTLSGSARMQAWKSPHLAAAAIPGAIDQVPETVRPILLNADSSHKRDFPLAVVNAGDVSKESDAARPGTTTLFRMTEPSARGLRHALSDPDSRIRLNSDDVPRQRPVLRAIHWDGGFLDGQTLVFSEHLNVLVGAPGAGKSTVIESVRAVFGLEANAKQAGRDAKLLAEAVLANATISVVVEHPSPRPSRIVVRRTYPHPPEVLDWDTFEPSGRRVADLRPLPEVYGQHEIAQLSADESRRTQVLRRFVPSDDKLDSEVSALSSRLLEIDGRLEEAELTVEEISGQAQLLAGYEAEPQKWVEQGIAKKLEQETLVQREHRFLKRLEDFAQDVLADLDDRASQLRAVPTLPDELREAPFRDQLEAAIEIAGAARSAALRSLEESRQAVASEQARLAEIRNAYKERRQNVEKELEAIRSSLGPGIKPTEFADVQRRVDEASDAKRALPEARATVDALEQERRTTLLAREEKLAEQTRKLEKAARQVNAKLGRVQVAVRSAPDLEGFRTFAADHLKGFRGQSHEVLAQQKGLSLRGLADACRQGEAAIGNLVPLTPADTRKLAALEPKQLRRLESLAPITTTQVELDVALSGPPIWRRIEDLSRGQKATAVLLLLLLPTEAPLLVDQPEDDLDNRFIVKDVVPSLRKTKSDRQYLFATHNANVPVLADAELIVGLTADEAAGSAGRGRVQPEHCGSIDRKSVRDLVERQLEGGRDAFEERRRRYGRR